MHHGSDDEQQGDVVRWLDELIVGSRPFADAFEVVDEAGVDGSAAPAARSSTPRVLRGGEERRSKRWAEVRLAVFAEPHAGEGRVATVRLSMVDGLDVPGAEMVRLAVHDVEAGRSIWVGKDRPRGECCLAMAAWTSGRVTVPA